MCRLVCEFGCACVAIFLAIGVISVAEAAADEPSEAAPKVVLITIDGLRWQEVFGGADESLMNRQWGSVRDESALSRRFWNADPLVRRRQLMPFFWSHIAEHGVVLGEPSRSQPVLVKNGLNFSYPGYNELLTGFPDPRIVSNKKIPNPNTTVLEWVNQQPGFESKVAVFGSWDVFPYIVNQQRSGLHVDAGWEASGAPTSTPESDQLLAAFYRELPRVWHNVRYDYLTHLAATEFLRKQHPRLMYVAYGETDDWAHEGRYDLYLDAAQRTDDYIRRIWELIQSDPFYKDQTTVLLTTDHGRGDSLTAWKDHGKDQPESSQIWVAAWGPAIDRARRSDESTVQGQVAASVASALNLDYNAAQPQAASPFPFLRLQEKR